ncbi:ATP-binding protein [Bacillus massilinigeriensis]|uniref:ATP-binding protein n=1 Tax=Bacillus massilionigeriensis TaxID=1805475 RepID=UPI00096B37EB|nr:ATP-binding protein [Bacillus massilionigeriensis]
MNEIFFSYDPILLITAIIITFISLFTAIDLFTLIDSSERNKRFLFLGGSFSLGIGISVMNFIGVLALENNDSITYNIPIIILSVLIGILFISLAFYSVINRRVKILHMIIASSFMTLAVFFIYFFGMYAMNVHIKFQPVLLLIGGILIFCSFLFVVWMLFHSKSFLYTYQMWLKPVSAIIGTGSIIEAHFLLIKSSTFFTRDELQQSQATQIVYLVLLLSLLIVAGLIVSSTLISKRWIASNRYLKDIKFALDQSAIVAFTDAKGMITSVNDKFCEISGYTREELIGKNHSILNSGFHSKAFFKELWKTIGQGRVWKGEIRNRAKDGHYYWVDTTIVPFLDEDGKPYQHLSIRSDITEKKKTESILHRQDKLAAVGQLAAGVAHEIRNPLTSMKGYAEYLHENIADIQKKEFVEIILDEIDRVNHIVEDFMVLAKPKAALLEEKNIIPMIHNVISLLEFEAKRRHVKIIFEAEKDMIQIECDEDRLKQVFINLIKNGLEAMPHGGELTVKVNMQKNQVKISVHDTGVGISEDNLKNIGEPFFTTKENGNGLGLMVSFQIIESHNGKVFIESEPNKGSTFTILLPLETEVI